MRRSRSLESAFALLEIGLGESMAGSTFAASSSHLTESVSGGRGASILLEHATEIVTIGEAGVVCYLFDGIIVMAQQLTRFIQSEI